MVSGVREMGFGETYTSDGFYFVKFPGVIRLRSSSHDVFVLFIKGVKG